ncbi:cytochrome P450 [Methylobacterium oryzae CBMB20]
MKANATQIWPKHAYREPITRRPFLGKTTFVLNDSDAIRHVLVDNQDNYERTKPTIRILRPTLGDGLFISSGQAWRQQRRALAPAFTPRAAEALLPHIHSAVDEALADLMEQADCGPVDLFTALQHLALEIAGRTMFSLGMHQHGPRLREMVIGYGEVLARPLLLDFLLPLRLPQPARSTAGALPQALGRVPREVLAARASYSARSGQPAISWTCCRPYATPRRARASPRRSCAIKSRP